MSVPPRHISFDHVSFAVEDALPVARRLRRALGVTPVCGETLPEFRYLLLYAGDATDGSRIELLDPSPHGPGGPGFLRRYLDKHGPAPHHITFLVPDLAVAVGTAREAGFAVVGEEYEHPSWQEAFVMPEPATGVVVQLAQTDAAYPAPADLLASRERDLDAMPSSKGAADRTWWTPLWEEPSGPHAVLAGTRLASTDPARLDALFAGVLSCAGEPTSDGTAYRWPGGTVVVVPAARSGVVGLDIAGAPADIDVDALLPGVTVALTPASD